MRIVDALIRAAFVLFVFFSLLIFASTSHGAGPPSISIKWGPPVMNDGTPLPAGATLSYQLFGGHTPNGPWSAPINFDSTATGTVRTNVSVGRDCYYMIAIVNGVAGDPTAVKCVDVQVSTVPGPPTNFQIAWQ